VDEVKDDLLEAAERQQVVVAHEVHKTTGGGDEDVASHLELLALVLGGSTTVDDARAQHSAVAETASLIEDLASKLAGGADDQHERLSADTVGRGIVAGRVRARSSKLTGLAHELGQDGKKESRSLAGAWMMSVIFSAGADAEMTYQSVQCRRRHVQTGQQECRTPEWELDDRTDRA
jgi:hypothetical protein